MRLNDPLVTSFFYEGTEYQIDLTYDNVLDVFDILDDDYIVGYKKAEGCLALLLGERIYGEEAVDLWNYVYEEFIYIEHKRPIKVDLEGNPLPVQKHDEQNKSIDLDKDGEFIYASFLQAYQMDLYKEQGSLQWSQFQALLNGLPSNTIMQRIIQIRLYKPSNNDSKEYKENMLELQKVYALEEVDE